MDRYLRYDSNGYLKGINTIAVKKKVKDAKNSVALAVRLKRKTQQL
jgi:hypothetical protein